MNSIIDFGELSDAFSVEFPRKPLFSSAHRREGNWAALLPLQRLSWKDINSDNWKSYSPEFWQVSAHWKRYFLPGIMGLTARSEDLETLPGDDWMSYVIALEWLMSDSQFRGLDSNALVGLTASQIDIFLAWLKDLAAVEQDDAFLKVLDFKEARKMLIKHSQ